MPAAEEHVVLLAQHHHAAHLSARVAVRGRVRPVQRSRRPAGLVSSAPKGRTSGVYVCERGTALLVRNTIADNGLAGVEVGAGGAVEAEENAIEGNAEAWVGAAAAVRTVT